MKMDIYDDGLSPNYQAEDEREVKWSSFEEDCRTFADSEPDGWAAVLRAVARAMKQQLELPC